MATIVASFIHDSALDWFSTWINNSALNDPNASAISGEDCWPVAMNHGSNIFRIIEVTRIDSKSNFAY